MFIVMTIAAVASAISVPAWRVWERETERRAMLELLPKDAVFPMPTSTSP
jgi:hypothetical protein